MNIISIYPRIEKKIDLDSITTILGKLYFYFKNFKIISGWVYHTVEHINTALFLVSVGPTKRLWVYYNHIAKTKFYHEWIKEFPDLPDFSLSLDESDESDYDDDNDNNMEIVDDNSEDNDNDFDYDEEMTDGDDSDSD